MKNVAWIAMVALMIFTPAYADPADWKSCMDAKAADCSNQCFTSSDISCEDKCNSTAYDQCIAEGHKPPE